MATIVNKKNGVETSKVTSPNGSLVLSASNSEVYISGNLQVLGTIDLPDMDNRYCLTSSFDAFTGSFSGSVKAIGDTRYAFTSSFDAFTGSMNLASSSFATSTVRLDSASGSFAASITRLDTASGSLGLASSSFASTTVQLVSASSSFASTTVQLVSASSSFANITDSLSLASSSFVTSITRLDTASGSLGLASSSFASSITRLDTASGSLGLASSSFASTTVQLVSASSSFAASITRLDTASGSLGLASSSFASITDSLSLASSSFAAGQQVTGSGDFFVTNVLKVSGSVVNPVGHLILSSSVGSIVHVSGGLNVSGSIMCSDGTAAAPGIRLTSAATGLYRYSASYLGVSIGGVYAAYLGTTISTTHFSAGSSGVIAWSSRSRLTSPADGKVKFTNNGDTAGFLLNGTTDGIAWLTTRGEIDSASFKVSKILVSSTGTITATEGYLVLSSSVGSVIYASGTLWSNELQVVSGTIDFTASVPGVGDVRYVMTASLVDQRVSSSIALSGTLLFPESNLSSHITAQNSHLILSSSAGSRVTVSGALTVCSGAITAPDGIQSIPGIRLTSEPSGLYYVATGELGLVANGTMRTKVSSAGNRIYGSSTVDLGSAFAWDTRAKLLSTADGQIKITNLAGTSGSIFDINTRDITWMQTSGALDRQAFQVSKILVSSTGTITASETHLILSSSVGSQVTISGNLGISGQYGYTQITTSTPVGTTQTIDWNNGNSQILDLGSTSGTPVTLDFSNMKTGASYTLRIIQHASSARTIIWTSVDWVSGVEPTISSVLSSTTIISFFYDGTTLYGSGDIVHSDLDGLGANDHVQYLLTASLADQRITGSVALSGCLIFPDTNKNYHIKAVNSHLILSSSVGSTVCISGGLKVTGYKEALSQYTITSGDYFIKADATSSSFGVVLPTAVGNAGVQYIVKKVDSTANAVVVSGSGGTEYIDDDVVQIIDTQWSSMSVISDGSKWLIV